jgi:hypothetical protein
MQQQELFVVESPKYARAGEGVYWAIDTTNYGGSPTSISVVALDMGNSANDVSGTVLTGSPTVATNTITLPKFLSASVGKFRLIVTFTNATYAPAKPALDVVVVA